MQQEGGAYGDGEEPLRVGPARHAFDGDLHRDSCPRPHIRSKASLGTRLQALAFSFRIKRFMIRRAGNQAKISFHNQARTSYSNIMYTK